MKLTLFLNGTHIQSFSLLLTRSSLSFCHYSTSPKTFRVFSQNKTKTVLVVILVFTFKNMSVLKFLSLILSQVDLANSGRVLASDAAVFLKKSGLTDLILGKVLLCVS